MMLSFLMGPKGQNNGDMSCRPENSSVGKLVTKMVAVGRRLGAKDASSSSLALIEDVDEFAEFAAMSGDSVGDEEIGEFRGSRSMARSPPSRKPNSMPFQTDIKKKVMYLENAELRPMIYRGNAL